MVIKKSEYQNQYRSSVAKKHQNVYLENLKLRYQRRDREFLHTPICWDELSDEDIVVSSDSCEDGETEPKKKQAPKEPAEQYQSLAEILSEAREKAEAARKKRTEDSSKLSHASQAAQDKHPDVLGLPTKVPSASKIAQEGQEDFNRQSDKNRKCVADKSYSIYDIVDEENKKLNEKLAKTYVLKPDGKLQEDLSDEADTDSDMKKADKFINECATIDESNLRKKTYTKKRNRESHAYGKARPSSSKGKRETRPESEGKICNCPGCPASSRSETVVPPLSFMPKVRRPDRQARIPKAKPTPVSPPVFVQERPPFISYGVGDREDTLTIHRTHNVRALVDVYPPALRAKTRREEQQRRMKQKEQRARSAEALLDKLVSASPREQVDWESEYRKQYHGYEPRDYERAVSARAVIPRAAPVRAVHRGGCLVVHVD